MEQLQSLLGQLVFNFRVTRMVLAFCRHLAWATKGVAVPHHYIRITKPMTWGRGCPSSSPTTPVMSVAGGVNELTAGAIHICSRFLWFWCFFQGEWSANCWPASWARMDLLRNLTRLERFLIIVAIELWGERLHNR